MAGAVAVTVWVAGRWGCRMRSMAGCHTDIDRRQESERVSRDSSSLWSLVDAEPPSTFTYIADLVAHVMEFCDGTTLLTMRLVSVAWAENTYVCWRLVFAAMRDARRRDRPLTLLDAVAASNNVAAFDVVEEGWMIQQASSSQPIVVMEHERLFPLKGFIKRRLPGDPPHWKQVTGPYTGELADRFAANTGGGDWIGDWHVVSSDATDRDGWQYASSWVSGKFAATWRPFVRRRMWQRECSVADDPG